MAGWLTGWTYCKSHVINPASGAGQNYQKKITIHYGAGVDSGSDVYLSGKCRTDFADIRFTNNNGIFLLSYWLDNKVNNDHAVFWVQLLDDLGVYASNIYIYYGNAGVTSISNGPATFIFFDDFETNLNNWQLIGGKSALRFNGNNNLGSPDGFGTIGDFDGYSPFTFECWFRTTATGEQPLITRMNLIGNGRGYCLYVINSHIGYEIRNTRYDPANEILLETNVRTINDGNWHHLVATYDGSQQVSGVHIYIDGTVEPYTTLSNTLTGTISNPSRFNVATYGGYVWLTGDVDEIVVYTSVLSLSDVVARYNNGEGTEEIVSGDVYAHYPMDEGTGTDVIDVSGHPERNLWMNSGSGVPPFPTWITGLVGGPVCSLDYAYSGSKCLKVPINAVVYRIQTPNQDKAVHIHFYDQMSPSVENTAFGIDAQEAEESWIGMINDTPSQYEYSIAGTTHSSGVNRTLGWHEFVVRCTTNLKQLIIDDIIMPITGVSNYCPNTAITTGPSDEVFAYWDAVFVRKFVSPEPSDGAWGAEQTGPIPSIYFAMEIVLPVTEDALACENVVSDLTRDSFSSAEDILSLSGSNHIPISSDEVLFSLSGSGHTPTLSEELLFNLLGSLHTPISSEELLFYLTKASRSAEDLLVALAKSSRLSVDIIESLLISTHGPFSAQDIFYLLSLSPHDSVSAQDIMLTLSKYAIQRMYPIIGGVHIIDAEGGDVE